MEATGPAIDVQETFGSAPIRIENLVLRGDVGVQAVVPTDLESLTFETDGAAAGSDCR